MVKRDHAIDVVRSVAIIAIVVGHVWDTPSLRQTLYTWHVPVFFFLTGYLWTEGRSVADELRRRAASLLKPYLFWWLVIFVCWLATSIMIDEVNPRAVVGAVYGGIAAGRPFTTFWFVFVLFASAVLWRALEKVPLVLRIMAVLLATAASVWLGPLLARTPLAIGAALPAMIFVAVGAFARCVTPTATMWRVVGGVGLLGCAVVLIAQGWAAPFDIKQGDWGTPVVSVVVASSISFALVLLASSISPWLGPAGGAASWFAVCGFTIVLVHPAMLSMFEGRLPAPILLVVAIGLPTLIARFGLRSKYSQWLTGIPSRASRFRVQSARSRR